MVVKLLILFCLTLIFIILLFILEKDKINVLYKLCYTFIISGSFIVIIGLLFKFIVKSNISFINIGEATNGIVSVFMIVSIIFYICGFVSYIGYYLIKKSV